MQLVSWFEIPAKDFDRAVKFYEDLFEIKLNKTEDENEQMAFFPAKANVSGAISKARNFKPAADGPVIYFNAKGKLDKYIDSCIKSGGKVIRQKTEIDEGRGFFAMVSDSEGNRIGFYSEI